MNAFQRVAAYLADFFGFSGGGSGADVTGGAPPVTSEIYADKPTPGPLTGDAAVNFPAALTYWTWNLYGADVSGTPNYPASTGAAPSQGGDWRQRVRDFLDSLGPSPTVTPGGPGNAPVPLPSGSSVPTSKFDPLFGTYDPVKPPPPAPPLDPSGKDPFGGMDPVRPWDLPAADPVHDPWAPGTDRWLDLSNWRTMSEFDFADQWWQNEDLRAERQRERANVGFGNSGGGGTPSGSDMIYSSGGYTKVVPGGPK
jgi:hypothetical protein